jgi:hypothetical protein
MIFAVGCQASKIGFFSGLLDLEAITAPRWPRSNPFRVSPGCGMVSRSTLPIFSERPHRPLLAFSDSSQFLSVVFNPANARDRLFDAEIQCQINEVVFCFFSRLVLLPPKHGGEIEQMKPDWH